LQGKGIIDAFPDLVVEENLDTEFLHGEINVGEAAMAQILTYPNAIIGLSDGGAQNRLKSFRAEVIDPKMNTEAASSRRPVMACSSSFPVWLMHCVVPLNGSTQLISEMPRHRATIASSVESAFTRTTSSWRTTTSSVTA
jgi:hypothetical protein